MEAIHHRSGEVATVYEDPRLTSISNNSREQTVASGSSSYMVCSILLLLLLKKLNAFRVILLLRAKR